MSDWDFLHDMHNKGYSAADISDAAAVGYAPGYGPDEDDEYDIGMTRDEEQALNLSALDSLEKMRQEGKISREQFLDCKKAILK